MWASRVDGPPSMHIDWQESNPVIFLSDDAVERAPTAFDDDPEADCFRLIDAASYQSFMMRPLRDGDVVLRAAVEPNHPQFVDRKPGICCKVFAVSPNLPVLALGDHPEDWKVLSPHKMVKATTPSNATGHDYPTDFFGQWHDFYLSHRSE